MSEVGRSLFARVAQFDGSGSGFHGRWSAARVGLSRRYLLTPLELNMVRFAKPPLKDARHAPSASIG